MIFTWVSVVAEEECDALTVSGDEKLLVCRKIRLAFFDIPSFPVGEWNRA